MAFSGANWDTSAHDRRIGEHTLACAMAEILKQLRCRYREIVGREVGNRIYQMPTEIVELVKARSGVDLNRMPVEEVCACGGYKVCPYKTS